VLPFRNEGFEGEAGFERPVHAFGEARVGFEGRTRRLGRDVFTANYHQRSVAYLRHRFGKQRLRLQSRCRDTTSGNSLFEGGTAATNPYDEEYDFGPCQIDRTHNLRASAIYQLPFTANAFVTGWQLSAIVSAVSGAPFTPLVGFDQSGLQTGGTQRPNLAAGRSLEDAVTGGRLDTTCGCIAGYFDPTFFTLPAAGTLGTGVGRDSLRGPGLLTVDFAVSKNIGLAGGTYLQLRAEMFNLFNRVNYGLPNAAVFVATADGAAAYNANAGQITTAGAPRQLQFGAKLVF